MRWGEWKFNCRAKNYNLKLAAELFKIWLTVDQKFQLKISSNLNKSLPFTLNLFLNLLPALILELIIKSLNNNSTIAH